MDSSLDHTTDGLLPLLGHCLSLRLKDPALKQTNAIRLFNGFYEGLPRLTADLFEGTLVLSDYDHNPIPDADWHQTIAHFYAQSLPNIDCALLKQRHAKDPTRRKGVVILGEQPSTAINENGTNYALDLRLNQDTSFYPDTRNLRLWLTSQMQSARVLNCFAYTGALGIAALAGGAREVWQTDLNPAFLEISKRSKALNTFTGSMPIVARDFYPAIADFKSRAELFDCVILDAPLFSQTRHGRVDLLKNWIGLVNKVRPLIGHGGRLAAINNALFLKGAELMDQISGLTSDGYLEVEEIIPAPEDVTGYTQSAVSHSPADPAPFNHSTKIIIMRAYRKDSRRA